MFSITHVTVGQNSGQMIAPSGSNCMLQNEDRLSLSPAPCSLVPRFGISLVEVLIAMGILTVGLLGVAALFPVGAFYMQKGDIADRGSAVAQAAFNEALTNGILNPKNWLMYETQSIPPTQTNPQYTYRKRFTTGLQNELVAQVATPPPNAMARSRSLNSKYGYAYVIDPIGVNNSRVDATGDAFDRTQYPTVQRFPYDAIVYNGIAYQSWWPWNPIGTNTSEARWPAMRVTLAQADVIVPAGTVGPWPMTTAIADQFFRSDDDLALSVPTQADRPGVQLWNKDVIAGNTRPLSRQSRGDYSWLATVVPPHADARDALATNPSAYEYEVSVAVFYKRILDNANTETSNSLSERQLIAKVVSTGLSGGELLVEQRPTSGTNMDKFPDPFGGLKTGNWVVVCGPHPASTAELPRFVLRWYRVLSIEGKDQKLSSTGLPTTDTTQPERRLVSLRGPQWPWEPAPLPGGLDDANHLSNSLCLSIIPNVVAVHAKTVRLEGNSSWSVQ